MGSELASALRAAYLGLVREEGNSKPEALAVSVRSSGATEDGVEHSFAGQFTSILNVCGPEALLAAYGTAFDRRPHGVPITHKKEG